ncbi:hypothetical protein fugu_009772 [Takifugu bimaculatus]|uniref:Uncharacterized protein n=1 Tax=Takifugu bimaculatus TaxID=433685 RepID=A0A4Z2CDP0_9TELE|nr:hypothetical protein fugu_009772 [Takifugu bimaculatus]
MMGVNSTPEQQQIIILSNLLEEPSFPLQGRLSLGGCSLLIQQGVPVYPAGPIRAPMMETAVSSWKKEPCLGSLEWCSSVTLMTYNISVLYLISHIDAYRYLRLKTPTHRRPPAEGVDEGSPPKLILTFSPRLLNISEVVFTLRDPSGRTFCVDKGRRGGAKRVKPESAVSGQEVGGPPAAVEEGGQSCAAPGGTIPQLFPFYGRSWQVETFRGRCRRCNPTGSET